MKEYALRQVKRLSECSGYVLMGAEFCVSSASESEYLLTFVHPLNRYASGENELFETETAGEVRIQLTCSSKYVTPSGLSTMKVGRTIKITCLGKVVSWDQHDQILQISPIAFY